VNGWQTISPRRDVNMSIKDMDDLILDLLSLRTLFLLLQDSTAIDNCKLLVSIAEALLVECWDFENLHMNRSEAVSRHLEHAVERRLRHVQVGIREKFQTAGEDPSVLRAVGDHAHAEMSEIQGRIDAIVSKNKDRFRYRTSERISALVKGNDRFIKWLEREERVNRALKDFVRDVDEEDEYIPDELNVDETRLLELLRDPYDRLDAATRISLESRGVDLTGVNYSVDD